MKLRFLAITLICATALILSGCSKDDEEPEEPVFDNTSLVGTWNCTYQKWIEDGETWDATYAADGSYYIRFNEDFTGNMDSGRDQLMEFGGHYDFTWSVSGNRIVVEIDNWEENDYWTVKKLSDKELELYWEDWEVDYNITCRFVKKIN